MRALWELLEAIARAMLFREDGAGAEDREEAERLREALRREQARAEALASDLEEVVAQLDALAHARLAERRGAAGQSEELRAARARIEELEGDLEELQAAIELDEAEGLAGRAAGLAAEAAGAKRCKPADRGGDRGG